MVMVDRTMAALRPQGAVLGAQAVLAMTTAMLHAPVIGEYSFIYVLSPAQPFAGTLKEGSPSQTRSHYVPYHSPPYTPWLPNVYG